MSRSAQILVASLLVAHLVGCSEEKVFNLRVLPPSSSCPDVGTFSAYVILTWEGDQMIGCVHGPCPPNATQPMGCLAGVETNAVEAGKALRVKAMLFGSSPTSAPLMCGDTATPNADLDLVALDMRLECAESCAGQQRCDPPVCWNEQKQYCPGFPP